jgi:UDP-glucuronate decarboxylase
MDPNSSLFSEAENICKKVDLHPLDGATILITGASGLIGTHFLATLCCLRELGSSLKVSAQIYSEIPEHTEKIIQRGGFNVIRMDLSDFSQYSKLFDADVIIHLAGYGQPMRFMMNPAATLQINTSATIALLQHLTSGGHFLFSSSSEVYSGLKNVAFTETVIGTTTPLHPRASYIEGKRGGEAACQAFHSQGVHSYAVRLGDIYGPGTRKHDKRALNSFVEMALCQNKIELLDTGKAIRTYCYVTDAVELMWKILLYGKESIYNVGGKTSITIAELAKEIGQLVNVPVIFPNEKKGVSGSPEQLLVDLTRINTEFHKKEFISLHDGLQATIEWQRGLYLKN